MLKIVCMMCPSFPSVGRHATPLQLASSFTMGLCVSCQNSPSSPPPPVAVFRDNAESVYDTPPSSQGGRGAQQVPSPQPLHRTTGPFPPPNCDHHIYAMIDNSSSTSTQHQPFRPPSPPLTPEATLADLLARKEAALAEVASRRAALEEARVRVEAAKGAQGAPFTRRDSPFLKTSLPVSLGGERSFPKVVSDPSSRVSPPQRVAHPAPNPTSSSTFPPAPKSLSPPPLDLSRVGGTGELATIVALKESAIADVKAKREALEESRLKVERLKAASQSLATGPRRVAQRPISPTRLARPSQSFLPLAGTK